MLFFNFHRINLIRIVLNCLEGNLANPKTLIVIKFYLKSHSMYEGQFHPLESFLGRN